MEFPRGPSSFPTKLNCDTGEKKYALSKCSTYVRRDQQMQKMTQGKMHVSSWKTDMLDVKRIRAVWRKG